MKYKIRLRDCSWIRMKDKIRLRDCSWIIQIPIFLWWVYMGFITIIILFTMISISLGLL